MVRAGEGCALRHRPGGQVAGVDGEGEHAVEYLAGLTDPGRPEAGRLEIGDPFLDGHAVDERFGSDALLLRAQHDRRAVGVVGAHVDAPVPAGLLEPYPDVGLDVLDHVAHVGWAIHIRERTRDEDFTLLFWHVRRAETTSLRRPRLCHGWAVST